MQSGRDHFLFFALIELWLVAASGSRKVISAATCQPDKGQNNSFLSPFPNHPTNISRSSHGCTLATISLLKLELAVSGIIQMLLVLSGIETNPGPTNPTGSGPASATNATCCNAKQHFNRVKKVIAEVQENFQTKIGPDTLTKPLIEIHEAGEWLL